MGDIIERGAPIFARPVGFSTAEGLKELQARREVDAFFGAENEERVVYHIQVGISMMLYLYAHEEGPRLIGVFKDYEALNLYIKENLK